jgi:hypothetical protein
MTNGSDRHHGPNGKKKPGSRTATQKDAAEKLKRKNLLPKSLAGGTKR